MASIFNGNTEIVQNSFDDTERGEYITPQSLTVSSAVSANYQETLSENVDELYEDKALEDLMYEIYLQSEWYNKYKNENKRIERKDMSEIYYYFKNEIINHYNYNIVQTFCAICEFFDFNYKLVYNNIISLKDKAEILETLEEHYNVDKQFYSTFKLF